jgi:acetyl-CoA carboxylase beta subunit
VSRILVQGGCAEHTEAALQAHADTGLRVVAVTTHPDEGGDWAAELS